MKAMGRSINFLIGLVIAFAVVLTTVEVATAQCDLSFKFKVEHTQNGQNNGKILLQLEKGEGPFTLRLFDLNAGNSEFLATRKFKNFSTTRYKVVFDKLKPSDYLVRIENNDCKKSLTGIEGLQIK